MLLRLLRLFLYENTVATHFLTVSSNQRWPQVLQQFLQLEVLQKYLAPFDVHRYTIDRKTVVRLLRSLRHRCNLHFYNNC